MRKFKPNLAFVTGLLFYAVAQLIEHGAGISNNATEFLMGTSAGLVILGAIQMAFPKFLGNTKFREWKQNLIGRD